MIRSRAVSIFRYKLLTAVTSRFATLTTANTKITWRCSITWLIQNFSCYLLHIRCHSENIFRNIYNFFKTYIFFTFLYIKHNNLMKEDLNNIKYSVLKINKNNKFKKNPSLWSRIYLWWQWLLYWSGEVTAAGSLHNRNNSAIRLSLPSRKCSVVYVIISEPPETQMGPSRSHA